MSKEIQKKEALAELAQKAAQRIREKKVRKTLQLHVPSWEDTIKIQSLFPEEIAQCFDFENSKQGDQYALLLGVLEPNLKELAQEVINSEKTLPADQRTIIEPLDITGIFTQAEQSEIVTKIMELSGVLGGDRVSVVTEDLKN